MSSLPLLFLSAFPGASHAVEDPVLPSREILGMTRGSRTLGAKMGIPPQPSSSLRAGRKLGLSETRGVPDRSLP